MSEMRFREIEFKKLGLAARWLDREHARNAYEFALQFSNKTRYGLDESTVAGIERHHIESPTVADAWMRARIPAQGTVQVVFGDDEVCVIDGTDFLVQWQNLFVPSRDDAIVLHNLSHAILFYCHEEELEVGHRKI